MASHPESAATSGMQAALRVALVSVRRQRAALSRQRALISEGGLNSRALGTKLQRLRAGQSLAGEDAEATRVAQLLSDQIVALEQDACGELLYMHSLLCEELRENKRQTEREAAKFRRRLLVGAARKRLQLLALFGEEEAGIRLLPHSILLPVDTGGSGGAVSRSIAVPITTIAYSGRSQVAKVAVVAERWNVMNPTLDMSLVTSSEAEHGPRSWRTEGYVVVPSECVERFLLAGILRGAAAAQASMAGGPPSQRRVRGQLGQNRQAHCAELVSQAPEIVLSGGPHACLAACLSECEASMATAGEHTSDHMSSPAVGYAVRCSVALRESHHPPAHREGAVVLCGSAEFGTVECLAVCPHEVIMFVTEERQLLGQCEPAVKMPTAGTKPTGTLRTEKASHRPTKSRGKHTGKHVDTNAADYTDDGRNSHTAETAPPQAASSTTAALQAGITTAALPHCMIVSDVLGELHAEDIEYSSASQAESGSGTGVISRLGGNDSAGTVRGGWRVPVYSVAGADGLQSEPSRRLGGKSLQSRIASGRWQQAEARLQQAIRTASLVAGSTERSLDHGLR